MGDQREWGRAIANAGHTIGGAVAKYGFDKMEHEQRMEEQKNHEQAVNDRMAQEADRKQSEALANQIGSSGAFMDEGYSEAPSYSVSQPENDDNEQVTRANETFYDYGRNEFESNPNDAMYNAWTGQSTHPAIRQNGLVSSGGNQKDAYLTVIRSAQKAGEQYGVPWKSIAVGHFNRLGLERNEAVKFTNKLELVQLQEEERRLTMRERSSLSRGLQDNSFAISGKKQDAEIDRLRKAGASKAEIKDYLLYGKDRPKAGSASVDPFDKIDYNDLLKQEDDVRNEDPEQYPDVKAARDKLAELDKNWFETDARKQARADAEAQITAGLARKDQKLASLGERKMAIRGGKPSGEKQETSTPKFGPPRVAKDGKTYVENLETGKFHLVK